MEWILRFRRWTRLVCMALAAVGAVALMVMMFLITFDVFGRDVFDSAILGTFEVVEYLMIPTVFLALAYGQSEDIHINVDVAIQFLSPRKRAALSVVTLLMTLAVFLPMAWVSYQQVMKVYDQKLAGLRAAWSHGQLEKAYGQCSEFRGYQMTRLLGRPVQYAEGFVRHWPTIGMPGLEDVSGGGPAQMG